MQLRRPRCVELDVVSVAEDQVFRGGICNDVPQPRLEVTRELHQIRVDVCASMAQEHVSHATSFARTLARRGNLGWKVRARRRAGPQLEVVVVSYAELRGLAVSLL